MKGSDVLGRYTAVEGVNSARVNRLQHSSGDVDDILTTSQQFVRFP